MKVVKVFVACRSDGGMWLRGFGFVINDNGSLEYMMSDYKSVGKLLRDAAIRYGCTHFLRNTRAGRIRKIPKSVIEHGRWG